MKGGNTKQSAFRGRAVAYDYPRIASVKKSLFKGLTLQTLGQEKIKFWFEKNQAEIIEVIVNHLSNKNVNASTALMNETCADQIAKFKELLDQGVISQDEYDAKKKQLLGL